MQPFSHQISGAQWLAERAHGYLGDPPGEGKTLTLLLALGLVRSERALVICPAIVRTHWKRQLDVSGHRGTIHPASYNTLVAGGMQMMQQLLELHKFDTVIVDEGHFTKNAGAQRTKIVLGKDGYVRRVPRVWLASGSPIPKHPGEYWTVMASVFPQVAIEHDLRTYHDWMERFCVVRVYRDRRGVWREKVVDAKNVEELQQILDATMIRRIGGDDVPKVWWQQITLDSDPTEVAMFQTEEYTIRMALEEGTLEAIANDEHVARIRRRIGLLKIAPVVSMLKSQLADSEEKVAVFAYHTEVIDGLAEGLAEFHPVVIDGRTSQRRRDDALDKFATNKAARIFIGQNTATGTGMDGLQYATRRGILVEPSWSNYENVQIGARLARRGQVGRVIVQFVALADTIDEAVIAQNVREARMEQNIFKEAR